MASEEFLMIGILDESTAKGYVKLEELKSFICEHIQVAPYYPVLIEALTAKGVSFEEKTKIDIQLIFEACNTAFFLRSIPSFYNKRITKYTIKLIKAGLIIYTRGFLTMKQIGDGASIHQMKEFEALSVGVPCNQETIESMLWIVGRTIGNDVLAKWIEIHEDYLEVRDTLMVHEFLYLLCNSKDKSELFQKIPKINMNPRMDQKIQLFHVDQEFHKTYKSPDYKIQQMLNVTYNVEKALYEGISNEKTKLSQKMQKNKGKQVLKTDPGVEGDEINEFRKHLRSMLVTVEIKKRIKEANQKLSRLKLNGQVAHDQLAAHAPFELPSPLGTKESQEEKPKPQFSSKKLQIIRPQTAASVKTQEPQITRLQQLRPEKPLHGFNFKISKSPGSSARKNTSASTLSTENRILSPNLPNSNQIRIHTSYSASDYVGNGVSFGLKVEKKNSEASYFTGDSKTDNSTNFESLIDEEYQRFEHVSKVNEVKNRPATARYFNEGSLKSHSTRILSSKH